MTQNHNQKLLSELQFWLRIMKEHAIFLRLGFPCTESRLIQMAQDFESCFAQLEQKSLRLCPDSDVKKLAQETLPVVLNFIQFKTLVLDRLIECNLGGSNFPLLVDHIRREAIRFAMNIVRLCRGETMTPTEELLADEVFWLRIMADHAKFINHLLDPSERKFICQSQMFSDTFDNLRFQAEDFDSILEITPRPIPSLLRFTEDVIQAGTDICNFKAAATQLLCQCKILSIIPPLLGDHVRREAERFLQDINFDLKVIKKCPGPCPRPSCTGTTEVPNISTVVPGISLEVTQNNEEKEYVTEVKTIDAEFSTPLRPIYRPKKNFNTGSITPIKINFV